MLAKIITRTLVNNNKRTTPSSSSFLFRTATAALSSSSSSSSSSINNNNLSLTRYDLDIGVTAVKEGSHYRGHVTDRWSIGNAPNGGYLMVLAINAAKQVVGNQHPDPLTITAYYVNKAFEDTPVDIEIRLITKAKSSSTIHMTMSQEGDIKSEYLAVFGNLSLNKGFTFNHKGEFSLLPSRQECFNASLPLRAKFGKALKIANETEIRIPKNDPFSLGIMKGKMGEKALLNCWIGLNDPRKPDLTSLAFFNDALPPPVVNLIPTSWVPTLEYTVHFWSHPTRTAGSDDKEDDYWLRGRFETLFAQNGFLYTDGEVWSADGKTLLATSRQFAKVMEPRK